MISDKKYWYVVPGEIQEVNGDLARKGIFHIWGGIASPDGATKGYVACVNWSGWPLQDKLDFEARSGVMPLPHALSGKPMHPQALKFLNDCMPDAAQENVITQADVTHDVIEKLTAHTGWHGWWPHL